MPIDEQFIAEIAAHIIQLEKSKSDESWSRYDRRQAAQAYIEQQMQAGREIARTFWLLDSTEYDKMLEEIAERGYQATLTQIRTELAQRDAQSQTASSINRWVDSGTIPPQVYEAYHLAYNNVTYRAVRTALEEIAAISKRTDQKLTEEFIVEAMNLLTDSAFERLRAPLYQGSEAKLTQLLRPLDSRLIGLAKRHLANFGGSLQPDYLTPLYLLTEALGVVRADLAATEQHTRRHDSHKARIAAEWLRAAILLIGVSADLLTDTHTPSVVWRRSAQEKLTAAFFAVKHGIVTSQNEDYTLPPKLKDAVLQLLEVLSVSDSSSS